MGRTAISAGGETGAAAAAQTGLLDLVDDLLLLHPERLGQSLIAAVGDVVVDIGGVDVAAVTHGDAHLGLEHRQVEEPGDAFDIALAARAQRQVGAGIIARQVVPDDFDHFVRGQVSVKNARPAGV